MRRFAFHRVYGLPDGLPGLVVVEVGEDGFYQSHFVLTGERSSVVWVGGVGVLLPEGVVPCRGDSVAALLGVMAPVAPSRRLRLWSAVGLPADAGCHAPVSGWLPVF